MIGDTVRSPRASRVDSCRFLFHFIFTIFSNGVPSPRRSDHSIPLCSSFLFARNRRSQRVLFSPKKSVYSKNRINPVSINTTGYYSRGQSH